MRRAPLHWSFRVAALLLWRSHRRFWGWCRWLRDLWSWQLLCPSWKSFRLARRKLTASLSICENCGIVAIETVEHQLADTLFIDCSLRRIFSKDAIELIASISTNDKLAVWAKVHTIVLMLLLFDEGTNSNRHLHSCLLRAASSLLPHFLWIHLNYIIPPFHPSRQTNTQQGKSNADDDCIVQ